MPSAHPRSWFSRLLVAKGVALVLLAVIHTIALLAYEYPRAANKMPAPLSRSYAVFFGLAGAFFAFLGLVDLLVARELDRGSQLAAALAWTSMLFTLASGLCGVILLGHGGPTALLACGALGLLTLLWRWFRRSSRA